VELLGSDKLETRLGAIYALEHIAQESRERHWPIMETLTAFVRDKARMHWPDAVAWEDILEAEDRPRPEDVQAALTVVGRRRPDYDGDGHRLNLSRTNLAHVQLEGARLEKADLSGAFIVGAYLFQARLNHAFLSNACLDGANLRFARLTSATLTRTSLCGSDLREAALDTANLTNATLSRACLIGADLRGTVGLTQEQLEDAWGDDTTKLPEGMTVAPRRPR
jgi:hypothetical protein